MNDQSQFKAIQTYQSPADTAQAKTAIEKKLSHDIYGSDEYLWYTSSTSEDRKKIPYVILQEFENKTDLLMQKLLYILKAAYSAKEIQKDTTFTDVYKNLYQAIPTGRNFRFPYFGKHPFSLTTSYSQIDTKNTEGLGESVAELRTNVLNSNKALGDFWDRFKGGFKAEETIEKQLAAARDGMKNTGINGYERRYGVTEGAQSIKSWTSAETGQYETTFTLVNKTPALVRSHYEFIRAFMKALAPSFPNTMMVKVPYLYEIYIPSVLHIPLGFIGNFSATPQGSSFISQPNAANNTNGLVIPEAWEIKMTFNSLFPVSTQLLDTIDDPFGTNYQLSPPSQWGLKPGYTHPRLNYILDRSYMQGLD